MANARSRRGGSRRGRSNAAQTQKIKSIVKSTLAASREKKHFQQVTTNQVINQTGTNFDMVPKVGQGVGVSQRVGNEIQWKSYHVRMIVKGGRLLSQGQVLRVIWYTPRVSNTLMPTSVSVTDFLDQEKFIIHSDKIHKIGTNIDRVNQEDPPSGTGAFKVLNFGRKFKKPATMVFDDNLATSLLTNHMRCYIVSTSPSSSLDYATAVDFMSTCYYTDA